MVLEIPQSDHVVIRHAKFVVTVVQYHSTSCLSLELKQKCLRDQIVLVHNSIHCDQEEIAFRFAGHLNELNNGVLA